VPFERITELSDIVSRTTRKIPVLENQLEIQRRTLSRMTEGEKRRDRARDAVTRVVATEILALGTMDLHAELAQLAGKSDARWDQRLAQLEASIEWANEIGRFGVLALGGIERDRFHQPGITNDEETWIYTADLMRGAMQAQVRPDFDRLDEKGARKPIEALVKHRDIVTRGLEAIDLEQANRKRSASIAFGIAAGAAFFAAGGVVLAPKFMTLSATVLTKTTAAGAAGGAAFGATRQGVQLLAGEHPTGSFDPGAVGQDAIVGGVLAPVVVLAPEVVPFLTGAGIVSGVNEMREGRPITGLFDVVASAAPFAHRGVRDATMGPGTLVGVLRGPGRMASLHTRGMRFVPVDSDIPTLWYPRFLRRDSTGRWREFGETAYTVEEGLGSGGPSLLHRLNPNDVRLTPAEARAVRDWINKNRDDALAPHQHRRRPGFSRDEFAFASTREGGAGSTVRVVPRRHNDAQGGILNQFYQRNGVGHLDPFRVRMIDSRPWASSNVAIASGAALAPFGTE